MTSRSIRVLAVLVSGHSLIGCYSTSRKQLKRWEEERDDLGLDYILDEEEPVDSGYVDFEFSARNWGATAEGARAAGRSTFKLTSVPRELFEALEILGDEMNSRVDHENRPELCAFVPESAAADQELRGPFEGRVGSTSELTTVQFVEKPDQSGSCVQVTHYVFARIPRRDALAKTSLEFGWLSMLHGIRVETLSQGAEERAAEPTFSCWRTAADFESEEILKARPSDRLILESRKCRGGKGGTWTFSARATQSQPTGVQLRDD